MGDDRPSRYEEDGNVIYRASALGMCMKSLVALALGMHPDPHPDWLLKAFAEGVAGEPVVLKELGKNWRLMDEAEGHQFTWHYGQILAEIHVGTNVIIRGHLDGVGTCYLAPVYEYGEGEWVVSDKRMIEVKCTTEDYGRVVLRKLPYQYLVQIVCYQHYVKLPVMLALGIKDENGEVVNVVTKMLDELPLSIRDVKLRVMEMEQWIERGELPPCDHPCWPCPFSWLCDLPGGPPTEDWQLEEMLQRSIDRVESQRVERARVRIDGEEG